MIPLRHKICIGLIIEMRQALESYRVNGGEGGHGPMRLGSATALVSRQKRQV